MPAARQAVAEQPVARGSRAAAWTPARRLGARPASGSARRCRARGQPGGDRVASAADSGRSPWSTISARTAPPRARAQSVGQQRQRQCCPARRRPPPPAAGRGSNGPRAPAARRTRLRGLSRRWPRRQLQPAADFSRRQRLPDRRRRRSGCRLASSPKVWQALSRSPIAASDMPSLSRLSGARGGALAVGAVVAREDRGGGRVVLAEEVGLAQPVGGGWRRADGRDSDGGTAEACSAPRPVAGLQQIERPCSCSGGHLGGAAGPAWPGPAPAAAGPAPRSADLPEDVLRRSAPGWLPAATVVRGMVAGPRRRRGTRRGLGRDRRARRAGGRALLHRAKPRVEIAEQLIDPAPRSAAARTRPPRSGR